MEAAFVLARFLQYAAASVLFGSTLLILWARLELRVSRPLIAGAGLGLAMAGCAGLVAQTALLAGSLADALRPETLVLVMQTMAFGPAAGVRIVIGLAAGLMTLALPISRRVLAANLACGAIACTSFAWSSHAAATEGPLRAVHLASDGIHALAAAGWVGSLVVLALMVVPAPRGNDRIAALAGVLTRFSALGMLLVAAIVVTGLVNSWLIFGFDAAAILSTPYGALLIAKLVAFTIMIALAGYHRQRLLPALLKSASTNAGVQDRSPSRARRSITAETMAGLTILALVALMGTLSPLG